MSVFDDLAMRVPTIGEIDLIVTRQVHPGKEADVEAILRQMQSETLAKDAGCLRYEWYRSDAPYTYVLLERWASRAAAEAHLRTPHMIALREKIAPLVPGDLGFVVLTKL